MTPMRQHIARALLAVLVLGGLVAPTVHRIQHQTGHSHQTAAVDPAVQAAEVTVQAEAVAPATHDLDCWLCSTHLVLKTSAQAIAPSPVLAEAGFIAAPVAFISSALLHHSFIRGPPVVG